ncbi:MAG: hypothetical protein ACREV0_05855, partial [Burkholderiales bacterium]
EKKVRTYLVKPEGRGDLAEERCYSLLVWNDQIASLATRRGQSPATLALRGLSANTSVAHARIYEISSSAPTSVVR